MAVVSELGRGLAAAGRGATILQLRAPEAGGAFLAGLARELVQRQALPVVVSSRVDVALAVDAAGVHLPERDLPATAARRLLGERLLGRSVHSLAAARQAASEGVDYLVFGPVFATLSHPGREPVGLAALAEVAASVSVPVLAIGGVDQKRGAECLAAGAAGYAAIGEFALAP